MAQRLSSRGRPPHRFANSARPDPVHEHSKTIRLCCRFIDTLYLDMCHGFSLWWVVSSPGSTKPNKDDNNSRSRGLEPPIYRHVSEVRRVAFTSIIPDRLRPRRRDRDQFLLPSKPSLIAIFQAPAKGCSRTMRSISCCEVMPTCLRNLRSDILNFSFSIFPPNS